MLRKFAAAAVIVPLLAACGSYPAAAQAPTPQQFALVDSVCTQIMGLRRGEYYYGQCQDSLSRSLAARDESEARLESYDDCRRQGHAEGSGALSVCMLDREDQARLRPADAETGAGISLSRADLAAGESYYNVTPAMHWKREQYSCAELGFVPGSSAFAHCVASLDADLLPGLQ